MSVSTYPKFKVAAVQATPVYLNLEATVDKCVKFIEEAAANGATLVAFPEGFIPGYPWFAFVGHTEHTKKFYSRLYQNAFEIPSPAARKISNAARDNNINVCISCSEKEGGSLYLAQVWFDSKGNLINKHRKMKPSVGERLVWGDGCGSMMKAVDIKTDDGKSFKAGGLMCWENYVPLDVLAMNEQVEQVHIAAWPGFFNDVIASRYYAISTQSFVLMVSSTYSEEMKDMICETKEQREYFDTFGSGHTCIYGPDGEAISEMIPAEQEGIAYADIDIAETIDYKYYMDPAGHYSNKALTMNINREDSRVVKKSGDQPDYCFSYEALHDNK